MASPALSPPALDAITIVLADDHGMVRAALRALLEGETDLDVVADAGDAAEALQRVVDEHPAVLVLDLTMPGELTALDCIQRVVEIAIERGRAVRPDLAVGVCGEHGGDPQSIRFFHAVGLQYVSCSPFRVPIARVAAAQAASDG
jgi:DNA-binding NarL/FixJ family response regulator